MEGLELIGAFSETSSVVSNDSHWRDRDVIRGNRNNQRRESSSSSSNSGQSRHQFIVKAGDERELVSISDHKVLDWFRLDHRGQIVKDAELPEFRQPVEELNNKLPIELADEIHLNIRCDDYFPVFKAKWSAFMNRLEELKDSVEELETPIICFTGVLVKAMTTPTDGMTWMVRVWKLKGKVYMRSGKEGHGLSNSEANNAIMNFH